MKLFQVEERIVCIKFTNFVLKSSIKSPNAFLQEILAPKKEVQRNKGLDFSLCGEESGGHVD